MDLFHGLLQGELPAAGRTSEVSFGEVFVEPLLLQSVTYISPFNNKPQTQRIEVPRSHGRSQSWWGVGVGEAPAECCSREPVSLERDSAAAGMQSTYCAA